MSNSEDTKEAPLSEKQPNEEAKEEPLPDEKPVTEVKEAPKAPKPTATGNEKISILKHGIYIKAKERGEVEKAGVELTIRNVSDSTIGTAVFEAVFYDIEGNTLDTVEHKTTELRPNTSRAIRINSTILEYGKIKSYDVRIVRTTTTDVEKVQLRRHERRKTETGEEEISGTVKNISGVKTDAALVANFYNPAKENIGTKVIILRDIEPNNIRQFALKYKPQEGDRVLKYDLTIGEIIE